MEIKTAIAFGAAAVALIGSFSFGYAWSDNKWTAKTEKENAHRQESARIAKEESDKKDSRHQDEITAIEKQALRQMESRDYELEKLKSSVSAGATGLRVAATCPTVRTDSTQQAGSSAMDSSTGPELNPDARQNYYALRKGITDTATQLDACIASVNKFIDNW